MLVGMLLRADGKRCAVYTTGHTHTYALSSKHATRMIAAVTTHSQHIGGIPTDALAVSLHQITTWLAPGRGIASLIAGHATGLADTFSIEIGLIGVINGTEVKLQIFLQV